MTLMAFSTDLDATRFANRELERDRNWHARCVAMSQFLRVGGERVGVEVVASDESQDQITNKIMANHEKWEGSTVVLRYLPGAVFGAPVGINVYEVNQGVIKITLDCSVFAPVGQGQGVLIKDGEFMQFRPDGAVFRSTNLYTGNRKDAETRGLKVLERYFQEAEGWLFARPKAA